MASVGMGLTCGNRYEFHSSRADRQGRYCGVPSNSAQTTVKKHVVGQVVRADEHYIHKIGHHQGSHQETSALAEEGIHRAGATKDLNHAVEIQEQTNQTELNSDCDQSVVR